MSILVKRFILPSWLVIAILLSIGTIDRSEAQWVSQNSNTSANLRSVVVVSNSTAAISGDNTTMLWTANGGTTWSPLTTNLPGNYLGLCFGDLDGYSIYLVGDRPSVVQSSDQGISWYAAPVPTTNTLNDISFLLADSIGIAVGNSGTVVRSTDYGATWKQINANTTSDLFAVNMYSGGEVDAIGANGTWIQSIDFGITWKTYSLPTTNTLYSFDFDNLSETGWMVGDQVILKTTDYGNTWTSQAFSNRSILRSISLTDSVTAFASGDNGRILKTTDGLNWIDQASNSTEGLNAIQMYSVDSGWAVGNRGTILAWQKSPAAVTSHTNSTVNQVAQNFPNPFSLSTTFQYQLPERAHVSVIIYDQLGRVAETLADAEQSSGMHTLTWNASRFPAGIYLSKFMLGNSAITQRLILTK